MVIRAACVRRSVRAAVAQMDVEGKWARHRVRVHLKWTDTANSTCGGRFIKWASILAVRRRDCNGGGHDTETPLYGLAPDYDLTLYVTSYDGGFPGVSAHEYFATLAYQAR